MQNFISKSFQNLSAKEHCVPSAILWINRVALFIIFFWFGFLKLISFSPAESLIIKLHQKTIAPFISLHHFLIVLGIVECIIGILWLIPKWTKFVMLLFILQMITTFLPLVLLPSETWNQFMVFSLSGQYIFKNVVLIASAFTIYKDCQIKGWIV